jgi:hypothetical protein
MIYHFIGSRVETRRFQAPWVNCIQLVPPHPSSTNASNITGSSKKVGHPSFGSITAAGV